MSGAFHLFDVTGVELEYMIVDAETLDVRPLADDLFRRAGGQRPPESQEEDEEEIQRHGIAWDNELVLHVVELKTAEPAVRLDGLTDSFQKNVREICSLLETRNARLLPTGMHPWMDPVRETHLWPHEMTEVYHSFDRIFGCRSHGWSNLQSVHINLPFSGDDEFGRLHSAVRFLLPILPALCASSPAADGRLTAFLDTRLEVYRNNCRRIPSVTGGVVPEPVLSRREYEEEILEGIYRDLAPHDPGGILRHDWVNARGAIARFDRGSIEIRVLDIQEYPAADLAVVAAIVAALEALVRESLAPWTAWRDWPQESLEGLLHGTIREAEGLLIEDTAYLEVLGWRQGSCTAGRLWRHIIDRTLARRTGSEEWAQALESILTEGSLSRRIVKALGRTPSRDRLRGAYQTLADCLAEGHGFPVTW